MDDGLKQHTATVSRYAHALRRRAHCGYRTVRADVGPPSALLMLYWRLVMLVVSSVRVDNTCFDDQALASRAAIRSLLTGFFVRHPVTMATPVAGQWLCTESTHSMRCCRCHESGRRRAKCPPEPAGGSRKSRCSPLITCKQLVTEYDEARTLVQLCRVGTVDILLWMPTRRPVSRHKSLRSSSSRPGFPLCASPSR